jgi:hypothetical protein
MEGEVSEEVKTDGRRIGENIENLSSRFEVLYMRFTKGFVRILDTFTVSLFT